MKLARGAATELAGRGALAVVLSGSFARGDAGPESDIDLYAIGDGESYRLERREPFLVSTSWRTADEERQAFRDPARAGGAVPGWRRARIFHDPSGIAAQLQAEAREWTWDIVGVGACDRFVASEITGLAEEVHKLVTMRASGRLSGAAVQRAILSFRLGVVMSVHLRLLYDTENALWDLVNRHLGGGWERAQATAFGLGDELFEVTCRASLELFALAAREVWGVLDESEREVVRYACHIADFPLG